MHNEVFSDGLIGDLGHHAVDSLASEVVQRWVFLDLLDAGVDERDEAFDLADVAGHECHVDGFGVGLLLNVEASLLESVCEFVAAEVSAFEGDDRRVRFSNQLELGVGLKVLNKFLNLDQHLCRYLSEAINAQI